MDQFQITSFSLRSAILALVFLTVSIVHYGCTLDGWRTAQWNICTTASYYKFNHPSYSQRIECRTKILADDTTRTAAQRERLFIAQTFLEDDNMYSFTFQEICEEDLRWIAAYVANGGEPADGPNADFDPKQYELIETFAPYAFLAYSTREMLMARAEEKDNDGDEGCGPGISTGFGVVAKRSDDTKGLKIQGLRNRDYNGGRHLTGLTQALIETPAICDGYFDWQLSTETLDYTSTFSKGFGRLDRCVDGIPDNLSGAATCILVPSKSRICNPIRRTVYFGKPVSTRNYLNLLTHKVSDTPKKFASPKATPKFRKTRAAFASEAAIGVVQF